MQYSPVTFIGKESHIRKFFHNLYYESEITAHTIFPPIAVHDITLTLFADCHQRLNQSCSFSEFNYYPYITLERYCANNLIEAPTCLIDLVTKQSYLHAFAKINRIIHCHYQRELSVAELVHLFILVFGRHSISDNSGEKNFCQKFNHHPQIKHLAHDLVATFLPQTKDMARERVLLESFFNVVHLKQMMTPMLNHNTSEVNTFVRENFPEEWRLCQAFFRTNSDYAYLWDAKSLTYIMASLTLYACSIQSLYWQDRKNVAFLFEGSHFICQYLRSSATRYIRSSRHFYFPDVNEMSSDYFKRHQIDLMVTNYTEYAAEYGATIVCLLFKTFPNKNDWDALASKLDPLFAAL